MSALHPTADITGNRRHVRFVPLADIAHLGSAGAIARGRASVLSRISPDERY